MTSADGSSSLQDEEPHAAAPEQAGQAGVDAAADRRADRERQRETGERPDHERAVHERDDRVTQQVGRIAGA